MALSNYILTEKDIKNSYSQILIEIYAMKDLHNIRRYCIKHGYKLIYALHEKESEEKKEHIHAIIKSDRKHRFNISSLISETLKHYNFMKSDTTNIDFINYVMHTDFDFKKKYPFYHIRFLNVSNRSIKEYRYSVEAQPLNDIIDDEDLYTPEEMERLLFKGYFKDFREIIEYCSKNAKLRRYFTFHSRQIKEAYYTCFNGDKMKSYEETNEDIYEKYNRC